MPAQAFTSVGAPPSTTTRPDAVSPPSIGSSSGPPDQPPIVWMVWKASSRLPLATDSISASSRTDEGGGDKEPVSAPQSIAHHVEMARLEDPGRERPAGKEHRVEGEDGDSMASFMIAVSTCDPPVGGVREVFLRPGAIRRAGCSERRQAP